MKILDFVFDFGTASLNGTGGLCRVRTYVAKDSKPVTFLTELDKNDGQSVTNAVEFIIEKLILDRGFNDHIFIEHYERDNDNFYMVFIENRRAKFNHLSKVEIENLIGNDDLTDLKNDRSSRNERILKQADSIRFKRNPWIDSPYQKSNSFIQRKLSIEKK